MREGSCPDVLVLDDGGIAVIGYLASSDIREQLSAHRAHVGPGEELVTIERKVFLDAVGDLPAQVLLTAKMRRSTEHLYHLIHYWVTMAVLRFGIAAQRFAAPIAAHPRFA